VFVLFALLTLTGVRRRWSVWALVLPAALAAWALAGSVIAHHVIRINRPIELPTDRFLQSGAGRVLDAGAGSGRSTVMVLRARPRATVTALDIYSGYFGIAGNTPERLRMNATRAGGAGRVAVQVGDMRGMPFADASFDAVVSAFAIDHLGPDGVAKTFAEIARVLEPGGEFLLMVINADLWVRVAYPSLHGHGYFGAPRDPEGWRGLWHRGLDQAGFEVVEQGTRPATLYFRSRKSPAPGVDASGERHQPGPPGASGGAMRQN
jgi:SAM-dependent methyltransferase